jgi:hypothetical protein
MDSVEDYARQWAKREKEDLDTLSEWLKSVRGILSSELSIPNSFIKQSMKCDLHTQTILLGAFSAETITYLSLRRDRCYIARRHLRKRKSWTIIGLFNVPLEFQPKMKNWIYHHSTGFLNCTSVLSNSAILMDATFGSLKIDVERLLINPLSFLILICISDLAFVTHSERISKSSFSRFAHTD